MRRKVRCLTSAVVVALLLLLLLCATPTVATSTLPLEQIRHVIGTRSQPFANAFLPASENLDARGLTVQIPLEDCLDQIRFIPTTNLSAISILMSRDSRLCATYFRPAVSGTQRSVGLFNFILRGLEIYLTAGEAYPGPVRIGWIYWFDVDFLVGSAEAQTLYYCPPATMPMMDFSAARSECAKWLAEPGVTTGILACPVTERVQRLLDYLRRKDGRPVERRPFTNQVIGYVTWIGHIGPGTVWDNGRFVSWNNFRPGHPTGGFPSVLDEANRWKSVLSLESHAFCCETTGRGQRIRDASGFIAIVPAANPEPAWQVINLTMNYDDAAFFAFRAARLATSTTERFFGFTAAFVGEDCDGTFRFVTPLTPAVPTLRYTHNVALCQVMVQNATDGAEASISGLNALIRDIRVMALTSDRRPLPGVAGPVRRISWMYWVRDSTPLFVNTFPLPHGYFCRHASLESVGASDMCSAYGGLDEAYLATVQTAWEGEFLQQLRADTSFYDDAWIGLDSASPREWRTGESLSYDNWAVNHPLSSFEPALLSAADASWRTQVIRSNHSYCCEFHGVASRGWSGAMQITPMGAPPPQPWQGRIGYRKERKFFPFININVGLPLATQRALVFGVSVQMQRDACFYSNGTSRAAEYVLELDPPGVPQRYVFCPSASSCPGQMLLRDHCAFYITRDDGLAVEASNFFALLKGVRFATPQRMFRDSTVLFAWALWGNGTQRIVLDPASGRQYWCAPPATAVTFTDALDFCRRWHGDGYLATVQSPEENAILGLARAVAEGYRAGPPFAGSVWLGHQRDAGSWLNGDSFRFSRWMSGQPDLTGPTQATSDGTWRNVFNGALTGPARASYCCERNGYSAATATLLAGEVVVTGPTESISETISVSGATLTETYSETPALTTAAIIPSRELTDSPTIDDTASETVTHDATATESQATVTMTKTLAITRTQTMTLTQSFDLNQIPRIEVLGDPERRDKLEGVVDSDAIRGRIAEKDLVELRTVTFYARNTNFRAGNEQQFFMDRIKIEPDRVSLFGFYALRDRMITPESFIVNATHLQIVFAKTDVIDIRDDEILRVTIDRSVTYLEDDQEPRSLPEFKIRILHGDEATTLATFFIVISTALAAIGSPQAFKDQQNMALLGAMKCARAPSRVVYRAGNRIISPVRYGDGLFAAWFGAFAPGYVAFMAHIIILLKRLVDNGKLVKALDAEVLAEEAAAVHFPSLSVWLLQLMHLGVTFFSIETMKYGTTIFDTLFGFWGCLFSFTLITLVLYWSFKFKGMSYFEYTETEMANVPPALKAIVPRGQWGPTAAQRMCRWIVGEYAVLRYASFEYIMGATTAGLTAWMPADLDECSLNYTVLGVFYIVCALLVLLLRPFRTYFCNAACVVSYVLLASMTLCGGNLVTDPFGPAALAAHAIRWTQTALCILRGLVGIAVLRLEHKLIGERRRKIKAEVARQQRELKIVSILDDDDDDNGAAGGSGLGKPLLLLSDREMSPRRGGGAAATDVVIDPVFGAIPAKRGGGSGVSGDGAADKVFYEGGGSPRNPLSQVLAGSPRSSDASGVLRIPVNRSIYSPEHDRAVSELDRRRKLQEVLDDSVGPRAGHLPQGGGVRTLPSWANI